jgi:SAM-dependent methyltransferase
MKANGKKKILDIGSGKSPYEAKAGTIVRADPDESCNPDYRCDLRKLPFANGEFDVVFSPALELYEPHETEDLLHEWTRVTKEDGELRLVVSKIDWIAGEIVKGKVSPDLLFTRRRLSCHTLESVREKLPEGWVAETVASDPGHIAMRITRE